MDGYQGEANCPRKNRSLVSDLVTECMFINFVTAYTKTRIDNVAVKLFSYLI